MRPDQLHPGDLIGGKYRVRSILGRSHGLLVDALHTEFDQRVVIKVLFPSDCSEKATKRFRREAKTLAKLESEHVARIIDVGRQDGSVYLVRQFLEGVDLATSMRRPGVLRVEEAVLYVLQIAEALAETHSHSIVLRELQPAHVFVTHRSGGAPLLKLTDFGTAKLMLNAAAPGEGSLTASTMFGLSPYSSPELVRKAKNVDARTDVWSLGAIFYELLTGRQPFVGEAASLMLQITRDEPIAARALRPELPPELESILGWSMAKDVDARFKNVHAFAHALLPFASPEGQVLIERIGQITSLGMERRAALSVVPHAPPSRSAMPRVSLPMPTPPPQRREEMTEILPLPPLPPRGATLGPLPLPSMPPRLALPAWSAPARTRALLASTSPSMGPHPTHAALPQRTPRRAYGTDASSMEPQAALPQRMPLPAFGADESVAPHAAPRGFGRELRSAPSSYPPPAALPPFRRAPASWAPPAEPEPISPSAGKTWSHRAIGGLDRRIALGALGLAMFTLPVMVFLLVMRREAPAPSSGPIVIATPSAVVPVAAAPIAPAPAAAPAPAPVQATSAPADSGAISLSSLPSSDDAPSGKASTSSRAAARSRPAPVSAPAAPPPPPEAAEVEAPASTENGTLAAVVVGGTCAFSVNGAAKGTTSTLRLSLKPGTYSVTCRPSSGATKSKSVAVKGGVTSMAMFRL